MNAQHKQLTEGRWFQMSFLGQMANIGSEIERALNWQARHNTAYCKKAFERALESLDLSLDDSRNIRRLKERTRVREAMVDHFAGVNQFASTERSWKKYFISATVENPRTYIR